MRLLNIYCHVCWKTTDVLALFATPGTLAPLWSLAGFRVNKKGSVNNYALSSHQTNGTMVALCTKAGFLYATRCQTGSRTTSKHGEERWRLQTTASSNTVHRITPATVQVGTWYLLAPIGITAAAPLCSECLELLLLDHRWYSHGHKYANTYRRTQ